METLVQAGGGFSSCRKRRQRVSRQRVQESQMKALLVTGLAVNFVTPGGLGCFV